MRSHHKGIRAHALKRLIDHEMEKPGNIVERPPALALHYPGSMVDELALSPRQRLENERQYHVVAEGDR